MPDGGGEPIKAPLRAAARLLRRLFSALLLMELMRAVPTVTGMLRSTRRSLPVVVARKSRGAQHDVVPGTKVSPLVSANDWDIGVVNVFLHANNPLPGTPTVVVSKNQRTIEFVFGGGC